MLMTLGEANGRRGRARGRVRRAPKRLADEEEGPQWATPDKLTQGNKARARGVRTG